MDWHDLLFLHWPVPAELLRPSIPHPLKLDTFEGDAWIAVVPFRMSNVAPRWVPSVPWMSAFPELNVRTYVTVDGKPGVWFFSLDATNPIAVRIARTFFNLPYMDARIKLDSRPDGWIDYRSVRTHRNEPKAEFQASYRPSSDPFFATAGSLEYFLTARYCLYAADKKKNVFRGDIDHLAWPLQRAECQLQTNSMVNPLGIEVSDTEPHLLFSKQISVVAWTNKRL